MKVGITTRYDEYLEKLNILGAFTSERKAGNFAIKCQKGRPGSCIDEYDVREMEVK